LQPIYHLSSVYIEALEPSLIDRVLIPYCPVDSIAKLTPDILAVVVGNYSAKTLSPTAGSFSVWKVYLRQSDPKVGKIADLTDAEFLNGSAAFDSHVVLIADSKLGVVFLLDTDTGKYGIVFDDETMKPVPGALVLIGINSVKTLGGYLYFTNTFAEALVRVKVDCETEKAAGPFDIMVKILSITDGFALAKDGTAFIGGSFSNVVIDISPQGVTNVNSSDVAGAI